VDDFVFKGYRVKSGTRQVQGPCNRYGLVRRKKRRLRLRQRHLLLLPGAVDLNTASLSDLNALPGIGTVKAQAIIDGRPYASMDDFVSKGIVSKSALDKFKDHVTVSGGSGSSKAANDNAAADANTSRANRTIDLNTATVDGNLKLCGYWHRQGTGHCCRSPLCVSSRFHIQEYRVKNCF